MHHAGHVVGQRLGGDLGSGVLGEVVLHSSLNVLPTNPDKLPQEVGIDFVLKVIMTNNQLANQP